MIGVGVIGAGMFGAVHANAIRSVNGLNVQAVCRTDHEAAAAFAMKYGGRAYTDWRDLLADPAVKVVLIATPHHLHEEMAVAAARAGKHILIEKPMANTAKACDAIIKAVSKAGVHCMVGHIMHFMQACRIAKRIIENGELGRPLVGWSSLSKAWHFNSRRSWHLRVETGGGMMMSAGIHALDLLVWLVNLPVCGVTAMVGNLFHEQPADDVALIGLRFANGALGQIQSIGYIDGAENRLAELICEKGSLRIDTANGVLIGRGGQWVPVDQSLETDSTHRALVREWESVLHIFENGGCPDVTGAYGRHIVSVIEASREAAATQCEVTPS